MQKAAAQKVFVGTRNAVVVGFVALFATSGLQPEFAGRAPAVYAQTSNSLVTFRALPSFGRGSEALAVDEAGTIIVGSAWDRVGLLHPVTWTLQGDGSWAITSLQWPQGATSAIARGVNNQADVAGNDYPFSTAHALSWLGGTVEPTMLGCGESGGITVYGISATAQVVVGAAGKAVVWPSNGCREELPLLVEGGSSVAFAVNGDGAIVGGGASAAVPSDPGVPVRWRNVAGQWLIEQLDTRRGSARGANGAGDLAGVVYVVPCASEDGCQRAAIWYAAGGSTELGTLGGEDSWARDINATGEVVGGSTAPNGFNTGYFWSESRGMVQLPFKGRWAAANALSDVRSDGTRLVVGMDSRGEAVVWVVRNP